MRRWLVGAALMLAATVASPAQAVTIAIVNGKVVTMGSAGTIERGTIIVRDGRILAVGAHFPIPQGAEVIDAQGKWVTPGLIDAGSHLGLSEVVAFANANDSGARESPYSAAFDVQFGLTAETTLIPMARSEGITRAAAMPASGAHIFSGLGALVTMSDQDPVLLSPRAFEFVELGTTGATSAGGARGAAWVEFLDDLHLAMIGTVPEDREKGLTRADLETLRAVATGKILLVAHVERASDIREVLALRASHPQMRFALFGASEAWIVADEIARARVPVILSPFGNLPSSFEALGATRRNAARLAAAGVRMGFMPNPRIELPMVGELRQAAGIAVANGLKWDDSSRALTLGPAQIFGIADRLGSLEPGKIGDIVIWDGDPLELSSAAVQVLIDGKPVSTRTRQAELRDRYR